ncbi:HlyD family efflux transporter periplasmic adaptor subunit [Amphritea sp. 1_MG-2023]|uniref:HlyD family efflux transporter periplasmic adaptor subunit n=1 Tax=Amphritea sp. 1_MG-2023 TaxID=3062670 RepID=UPI0026E16205|nr:HlyD family efflux transporter periplasmic adaptor subunit [Amphritea sp. 1_MG-2023]MDO6564935.1 HlyD family efflux transporter periplasmic adaptor subunit [Amphritea sp. 1_MG-2023]
MNQANLLPPLREELSLFPGASAADGSPTWVIHDLASNRFFTIGWFEFQVLSHWHRGSAEAITTHLAANTTLMITVEDVEQVGKFLSAHNLIQLTGQRGTEHLLQQHQARQVGKFKWLLKNYLFVRVPLIHPDYFLDATLAYVRWLWSPIALILICMCAVSGLILLQSQWETFLTSFPYMFTLQGMLIVGISLAGVKVLHEFGHAYALKNFGCRVPSMGVAFLVMWPVLFTDASDSWRLVSRRQRLLIGAAGIFVELSLAAIATVVWSFLADGPIRSAVFLIASTTWIATLLINLNPFMRFDGYYLMSDWLEIPNLQNRAFALARWRLREWLFGFNDEAPEYFPKLRSQGLIFYAYATWVYRFFLFLGIALLVYFLFFKALGIFLMLVELTWFIVMPIFNEVKQWWVRRNEMQINKQVRRTLLLVLFLLMGLFYPWDSLVSLPSIWRAEQQVQVYSLQAGQITHVYSKQGDVIEADQLLLEQRSPDLEYAIIQGQHRIDDINHQIALRGISPEMQKRAPILWHELEAERAAQRARLQQQQELMIRSSISGTLVELMQPLEIDEWLPAGTYLATIIAPDSGLLEAYVFEQDLLEIAVGATGWFYPNDSLLTPIKVSVVAIDSASTRNLVDPYLASTQGGEIATRQSQDGSLSPDTPIYRVLARPIEDLDAPAQVMLGNIRLEGESRSIFERLLLKVLPVFIYESSL